MQGNKRTSSSEQYIKKSNRNLLIGGIVLILVFLLVLAFMPSRQRRMEEHSNINYIVDPLSSDIPNSTEVELFGRGDANLKVEPLQIDMNNVVLGSKVEAIITLTAEKQNVRVNSVGFAEQQADGFRTDTNCLNGSIPVGKSCTIKVLWNPTALQQLQNNLQIVWKEDIPTSMREMTTTVQVKGQSTDSKDCVICEDIRNQEEAEPRHAVLMDGTVVDVGEDGRVVLPDGTVLTVTENGVLLNDQGEIVGVVEPEYIPLDLKNEIMGTISSTKEVIDADGKKLGKVLGDKTIVDTQLTVLGAGVPVVSILNLQGQVVGKMTREGTVIDGTNTVIAKVRVDGQAVKTDGSLLGFVRPWGLVADFSGKILGAIIPDGTVIDAKNDTIARITPNGFAISPQGELIGATIPQGVAVGAGCQSLGRVSMNGDVTDSYDAKVGKVLLDGTVINEANEDVGFVISQGIVINEKSEPIGFVNSEGKAVSAKGKVIGCINPDGSVSAGKKLVGAVLARGVVIGNSCGYIGTVYPNAEVFDINMQMIGHVLPDGLVRSLENKTIGRVVSRAAAVANGCRLLGLVNINGQVLDLQNKLVGCITPELMVTDTQGSVIGAVADKGTVYKEDGSVLGRIRFDGKVMDLNGQIIGCINADHSVTSLTGEVLVRGRDSSGTVIDENGNPRGWSRIGSSVYDQNGTLIGTVNANNVIVDANGRYIGFLPRDGVIFSPDGLILGRYSSKVGYAVNQSGERFGKILPDMTVVSGDTGEVVGGLIPDNSGFVALDGSFLAFMKVDGTLKKQDGSVIGAIRGDGSVVDKEGTIIGYRAQEGWVLSPTGKKVGVATIHGDVFSVAGTRIGSTNAAGIAISTEGKILGGVLPQLALIMDANGLSGYLAPDGVVTGLTGAVIGVASPFGSVISSEGEITSKLVKFGTYHDYENKVVGWLSFDGLLLGKDGRPMGTVTPNGIAFDKSNNYLGAQAKKGIAVGEDGQFVSMMNVSNQLFQKDKLRGTGSSSPFIYSSEGTPVARVLSAGVGISLDGSLLGWTGSNGEITNGKEVLGFVRFDNRITNAKGGIVGTYIPLSAAAYDDSGKSIGLVGRDGAVVSSNEQIRGRIRGTQYVFNNDDVVGRLLADIPFVSNNLLGRTSGLADLSGTVVSLSSKKTVGDLLANAYVTGLNRQVIGHETDQGNPISNTLKVLGISGLNGEVGSKGQFAGRVSGIGAIYDSNNTIIGSVMPMTTMIDRAGRYVGRSVSNVQILDKGGKPVAVQMNFGIALAQDNSWVGGLLPSGVAVNDDAETIGGVAADGAVVDKSGTVVGRALPDKSVSVAADREYFNTMPYAGGLVAQGMPFSYRNVIWGTTSVDGNVVDNSGQKIFRILDDGTILGKIDPLEGAVLPFVSAVDQKGQFLGTLAGNGQVLTPTGESRGKIAVNEAVKGGEFEILGLLVPTRTITNDCKMVGMTAFTGQVVNSKGVVVGRVLPDRTAVSKSGEVIGRVTRNGLAISPDGTYLGRTLLDSTVVDPKGVNIACARNDGTVVDHNGNVIGNVIERGLVLGKDGKPLGRIKANGQVVNARGEAIGRVLANGDVVDENGVVIGHNVARDQELLFDENGNIKGTLSSDGTFRDPKTGEVLFRVKPNGEVVDAKGNLIGSYSKDKGFQTLDGKSLDELTLLKDAAGNTLGIVSGCDVVNAYGDKIGSILANGDVVDLNGDIFARIMGDGSILDRNGKPMGKVQGTSVRLDKCGIRSTSVSRDERIMGQVLDKDGSGKAVYKVGDGYIKDGKYYDKDGNLIGTVGEDGLIRDENGNVIGYVDENGVPHLKTGEIIDGKLYDENGNLIGTVDEDGLIRDKNGNVIGYVDENGVVHLYGDRASSNEYSMGSTGRSIFIGNKRYDVDPKGSIVSEDGVIIGYMGEDGKPYTLDNRPLTASGDATGRSRPDMATAPLVTPEQVEKMKKLLDKKRESMRVGISSRSKIMASDRIKAMSRQKRDKYWKESGRIVSSWPVDMSRMILKDKAIPAVLVRSVDSRFSETPVTAIVERHVYAEGGRNILIPAGSRLIGSMSSGGGTGTVAKMKITWDRLIRPDGGAFHFSAKSGDAQGRGGVAAYLDDQLVNKYGKPVMTSVITSAISYMMAVNNDYTQNNVENGLTSQSNKSQAMNEARVNFINTMDKIFNQLLDDATDIPPVVFVPSGTRVTVFANEDLWLRSENDDVEEYSSSDNNNGADFSQIQKPDTSSWVDQRSGSNSERTSSNNDESSESSKESLPDYYKPDDAYKEEFISTSSDAPKAAVTTSTVTPNTPVYDGSGSSGGTTEQVPLSERRAAPVLPKTGASNYLF